MDTVIGVLVGIFVLVVLVVLHELGHALMAMRSGVKVEEFGIGFPPRAWSKKLKNGVLFSLNWLPLGGFVKLHGESDDARGVGTYGGASYAQKTRILFAGVAMNLIAAVYIFSVLAAIGMPKILENQFTLPFDTYTKFSGVTISSTVSNHPAEKLGMVAGDKIWVVNGQNVTSTQQFIDFTKSNPGQSVQIVWSHDSTYHNSTIKLNDKPDGGYFGASLDSKTTYYSTWSAPIVGIGLTAQLSYETVKGLGTLIYDLCDSIVSQVNFNQATRQAGAAKLANLGNSVAGPIGIFGMMFPAADKQGFAAVLLLSGVISLTLAIMNALPIPSLDGGRWAVTTYFKLRKKHLSKETEEKIHGIGFMVLMALVVLITISDVTKIF